MAGSEPNPIILKILSGTQSGVDIPLIDGDYTLGSSDDDDIQIFDVSLMAGHAKIAVRSGKVEIAGAAGQLRSRNGVTLEPKGDAQELEPLDIVSAGTTRFALGTRNANWASITEVNEDEATAAPRKRHASPGAKGATAAGDGLRWRSWHTAIPISLVVALVALGIWFSSTSAANRNPSAEEIAKTELETVRSAIAAFDFTDAVEVRQEVDGVIYVTGFVEEPVQRRAIMTATRDLDVQARVRLSVLDTMRSEVENLLSEERVDVVPTVSPKGALTLSGVLLDAGRAEEIVALVTERVRGFSSITSDIETGPTLLAKVNDLATRSQITPLVIVRLDGSLIEASGVLPTEKIDQWVGFLQSYASQFAASIPLRSLVQLQNRDGTVIEAPTAGNALVLGGQIEALGGLPLDVSKLRAGAFRMADIFVGQPREGEDAVVEPVGDASSVTPRTRFTGGDVAGLGAGTGSASRAGFDLSVLLGSKLGQTAGLPSTDATSGGEGSADAARRPEGSDLRAGSATVAGPPDGAVERDPTTPRRVGEEIGTTGDILTGMQSRTYDGGDETAANREAGPAGPDAPENARVGGLEPRGTDKAASMARRLIELWQVGDLPDDEAGRRLTIGMDALDRAADAAGSAEIEFGPIVSRYQPLLAGMRPANGGGEACWQGSLLTQSTVGGALFWLDLLSVTRELSLTDLGDELQPPVIEAALNPEGAEECAVRNGRSIRSVYIYEARRNPLFADFVMRDVPTFRLDIAGVSFARERFIQTRDGRKMREGAAPDATSRIANVGELGVAIQRSNGYAKVLFDDGVNWMIR